MVVLPDPEAPISASSSPAAISSETSSTAVCSPKRRVTLERERARAHCLCPRFLMFVSQYFIHSSRCSAITRRSTAIGLICAFASWIHFGSVKTGMSVRAGILRNCSAAALRASGVVTNS